MLERKVTHSSWQVILGLTETSDKFPQTDYNKPKHPLPNKNTLVEVAYELLHDVGYKKRSFVFLARFL